MAALLVSCGPSQLQTDFARHTGCDPEHVEVIQVTDKPVETHQVSGCSDGARYYCIDGRCDSPKFEVKRRHSYRHGCNPEDVGALELGDDLFIADGCGHKATYQCETTPATVVRCNEKAP